MPDLHDVAHQVGLVIKGAPRSLATVIGIVLKRKKCQIVHPPMLLQIIQKAPEPRDLAVRIGPRFNILIHSREGWPTQLQPGIDTVKRRRPLQVERPVVLRHHELPVRFLAHFNIGNRVMTILQISNLSRRVFRSVVKQRHRNHRRQPPRDPAVVEQIESNLCLPRARQIGRLMPGIDRRAIGRSLLLIPRVP